MTPRDVLHELPGRGGVVLRLRDLPTKGARVRECQDRGWKTEQTADGEIVWRDEIEGGCHSLDEMVTVEARRDQLADTRHIGAADTEPEETAGSVAEADPSRNGPAQSEASVSPQAAPDDAGSDRTEERVEPSAADLERAARFRPTVEAEPFEGLSHDEAKTAALPDEDRYLVEGIVPAGAVGTIAGLPETHKSFLAQALATRCAQGDGEVLSRRVVRSARVGYFWQDDSRREELERIRLFERVHATPEGLPLTWFLNVGLQLPRDLGRLRATVEHYRLELAILDSFYNFAFGLNLREAEAETLVAQLKSEVSDPCACGVLIVDHMPWGPPEGNRKRLRAYGGVHKGAAVRFGLYIDAEGKRLWVEARGNNMPGFKRTPAYWDADALELRLADTEPDESDAELDAAVLAWLTETGGSHSTSVVRRAVKGQNERVDSALERLRGRGEVRDHARGGGAWLGAKGTPRYWIASVHAESTPPQLFEARSGEVAAEAPAWETSPTPPLPRRGGEVERGEVQEEAPDLPDRDRDLPGKARAS